MSVAASCNSLGRPMGALSLSVIRMVALFLPLSWIGSRIWGVDGIWIGAATANLVANPPTEAHPYPTSFILCVPLFHVTGLVPVMLSCFLGGFKLVIMYKWNAERALEHIEKERITTFVGVPTNVVNPPMLAE